jgi:23S rRNA (pseudouridine1915-N3)-methyltransferase
MRLTICAVGRMKRGAELDLTKDYLVGFAKAGRSLGFTKIDVREVEDKKNGGSKAEALLLQNVLPDGARVWCLDERGESLSSPQFAQNLAGARDDGTGDLAIVIGGADGLTQAFRAQSHKQITLGQMVWPHMLVRVMLAEQLYRAVTILNGSPYHRN